MARNNKSYLILTGWGYAVYACAAALMYRALDQKADILGMSMRKLPDYLANVKGYTHIMILGIGLVNDPETIESSLKRLKKDGVTVSWFSELPLPAESADVFAPLLDVHIDRRGLMYAVRAVYPKLTAFDFTRLELLAGLDPAELTKTFKADSLEIPKFSAMARRKPSPKVDGKLSDLIDFEHDDFDLNQDQELNPDKDEFLEESCCIDFDHENLSLSDLSPFPGVADKYLSASYEDASRSLKKLQNEQARESAKCSKNMQVPVSAESDAKIPTETIDIAEYRMLIAAAMYYYRNFRDDTLYAQVIEHLGKGGWHKLTSSERKIIAWYKRFGSREIVGRSPAVEALRLSIEQVAAKDQLRVLIHGESGTGKENIAEQIHSRSSRQDECFLTFNCANVPENLMESRLFGYEKGAFTGADTTTKGLFENAHHGTLFLDEIGELSLECQGNLLRVLDSGRFMRVGGHEEIETDVRVICATNRNLAEMVRDGKFRMDLFYRLNVARIEAPALREHLSDLPEIANHRWKQLGHAGLTDAQLSVLRNYDYPGNVRELFNILDYADAFDCTDFSGMMQRHKLSVQPFADALRQRNAPPSKDVPPAAEPATETLDEFSMKYVLRVYRENGGRAKQTADLLGISYNTLKGYLTRAEEKFGTKA